MYDIIVYSEDKAVHFSIDHNSGIPISTQLIDQIKYMVMSRQLSPGEQIPSVRALAHQLKLNPTTVARVYQQLEAEEIIYMQQGRGTFIAHRGSSLPFAEKCERMRSAVRALAVESVRIGLTSEELMRLLDQELGMLETKGEKP